RFQGKGTKCRITLESLVQVE
ncbi:hypothetical protein, partial [Plasmodium yoelii yoelii]